jgi:drug/metabolite transporter (DMT)-like permease
LLPFVYLELKRTRIDLKDLPNLIALGILGYGSMLFLFEGFRYTTAIDAAIIGVVAPIIEVAAGNYFYKEKLSLRYKIGVLLAIVGTIVVVIEPALIHSTSNNASSRILGNIFVLVYNFGFASYIVLSKSLMGENSSRLLNVLRYFGIKKNSYKYSPFMQTSLSFYIALAFFTGLLVLKSSLSPASLDLNIRIFETKALLGVLYMAILSGISAYTLYSWGLHRVSVSFAAIFSYLMPVFTLPFAYFMLGEVPTPVALIGSAIIGTGILIAEYKTRV